MKRDGNNDDGDHNNNNNNLEEQSGTSNGAGNLLPDFSRLFFARPDYPLISIICTWVIEDESHCSSALNLVRVFRLRMAKMKKDGLFSLRERLTRYLPLLV